LNTTNEKFFLTSSFDQGAARQPQPNLHHENHEHHGEKSSNLSYSILRVLRATILKSFIFMTRFLTGLTGWTGFGNHRPGRSYPLNPIHPVQTSFFGCGLPHCSLRGEKGLSEMSECGILLCKIRQKPVRSL
jgi:hypothetical protein